MINLDIDKIFNIVKTLFAFLAGYFSAKKAEKINTLEKEVEDFKAKEIIKEKQEQIKKEVLTREEVYDVKTW